jgi:tetratricopeptide (TPR) repeat protein
MADLKEETTVDNQVEETAAPRKKFDTSYEGLQLFYEQNKKVVNYVGGGLLVIVAAFIYFKLSWLPEKEAEAVNEIFWPQTYFEKDSFNLALNGGAMVMSPDGQKQMMGFAAIAEEYSITESGNLANFYAGICCLHMGRFEEAIDYLKKYNGGDHIATPLSLGAIGDASLELNRLDDAARYYLKAAEKRKNGFTSPYYLKKAGFAKELNSDFRGAAEVYERIFREYPAATEGRDIEKDIARVKARGNL